MNIREIKQRLLSMAKLQHLSMQEPGYLFDYKAKKKVVFPLIYFNRYNEPEIILSHNSSQLEIIKSHKTIQFYIDSSKEMNSVYSIKKGKWLSFSSQFGQSNVKEKKTSKILDYAIVGILFALGLLFYFIVSG